MSFSTKSVQKKHYGDLKSIIQKKRGYNIGTRRIN